MKKYFLLSLGLGLLIVFQNFAQARAIHGQYIVVFKDSVENPKAAAAQMIRDRGGKLLHAYSNSIKGFSAQLPEAALEALRRNPNVKYIEQDVTVELQEMQQVAVSGWGLDRIDQYDRPLDSQYHYNFTGAGVYAFVIDTGIRADHVEFTGRLLSGFSAIQDGYGTEGCHGHGTHVAGTLGGTTWGVAKGVSLIPVRVLDCNGSGAWSGVIAGIDWVAGSSLRPSVANLSLGGPVGDSIDAAVAGAIAKGVTVVVAAGNSSADACNFSPARESNAITVGASTVLDGRASFSNYGSCLDLFAPGSGITSAWNTSSTATKELGGTSMASPHVAGVVALALQVNPSASPEQIMSTVISNATANRLYGPSIGPGSPNLLVYSILDSGGGVPSPSQTVAVETISGSSTKSGKNWRANVVIKVRDVSSGSRVSNATVSGSFSVGGSASCVTDSTGSCTLSSSPLKNSITRATFKANGISGVNMIYDASKNLISEIVILKP